MHRGLSELDPNMFELFGEMLNSLPMMWAELSEEGQYEAWSLCRASRNPLRIEQEIERAHVGS